MQNPGSLNWILMICCHSWGWVNSKLRRTVVADSSPWLGFFIMDFGLPGQVYTPVGGRTKWDLHQAAWNPAVPWGCDILPFRNELIGTVHWRPRGESEAKGGGWVGRLVDTAQSCLQRDWPRLARGCLSRHWAALVFYLISTWINRSRTSSPARLRICQNSPGN